MNNTKKQPNGFTLLELLLVLLVICAILLASYSRYRHYAQIKDIAVIKQNVATLQQFEDICYATMMANKDRSKTPACQATNITFNRSICGKLVKDYHLKLNQSGLVKDTSGNNYKIGSDLTLTIKAPASDPCGKNKYYNHRLIVTVKLDANKVPATTQSWYKNMLGANTNNSNTFIWQKLPSYSVAAIGGNLWIMGAGLRAFKKAETMNGSLKDSTKRQS